MVIVNAWHMASGHAPLRAFSHVCFGDVGTLPFLFFRLRHYFYFIFSLSLSLFLFFFLFFLLFSFIFIFIYVFLFFFVFYFFYFFFFFFILLLFYFFFCCFFFYFCVFFFSFFFFFFLYFFCLFIFFLCVFIFFFFFFSAFTLRARPSCHNRLRLDRRARLDFGFFRVSLVSPVYVLFVRCGCSWPPDSRRLVGPRWPSDGSTHRRLGTDDPFA